MIKFHIQILWYSFTRDNRFLLTSSQSLPEKQENPSTTASRHINTSLSMYLFLDSELSDGRMKVDYFKINTSIFCWSIFFKEECLNHPSPSELTSMIQPFILLRTPKGFIFPEYFLNFFSNPCIAPWLSNNFKFMVLRLLENAFVGHEIESVHFYSCSLAKRSPRFLSLPFQAGGNYPFPRKIDQNKTFWQRFW